MEGNPVASYIFRGKDQAVTMDIKSTIKIQDEYVHVDPRLLFLSGAAEGWYEEWRVTECLRSRIDLLLSPALFESVNAIRPTTKSSLADALWCSEAEILPGPSETVQYVLDGEQYNAYVIRKYGRTIVVFDGYSDNPSTNDCAHMRRSGGTIGVTVHFISSMALQVKKDVFLSNKHNKQRFIAFLSQRLEQAGCEIHQARGDAVLIVYTALISSANQETVLIGDDTDLLALLIYHAKNVRHNVLFRPETRWASQKGNRY